MKEDLISFGSFMASHRLVLLHGWGADLEDLLPLGKEIIKGIELNIELVSLRAPNNHPDGFGRQWYGLFPPDWSSVPKAVSDLTSRIKSLATDEIPIRKTALLGFSQGAAMALDAGCDIEIAGVVACSGYPHPLWEPPSNCPPVLLIHGKGDEVVPSIASQKLLNSFNFPLNKVDLHLFDGGHEVPFDVIPIIQSSLKGWFN